MQKDEEFAAGVTRDLRVIEAISETLFTLELIHQAGVTINGEEDVLDFSCAILKLKGALRVVEVGDEDDEAREKAGDYEPI